MSMQSVTFEASEESIATIDEIAANREVDRAEILHDAIALYLADYEQLKADIAEGERDIDAGNFVTHEEVEARFEARLQRTKAA